MNIIVAVDSDWGIGCKGNLLEYIKGDLEYFKQKTLNKVVVLGRETLKTFPNQKPLKNRLNIILTKDESFTVENAEVVHSIGELLDSLKKYNTADVYIIGGESVYRQLLSHADVCYVTKIHKQHQADRFFPNLDESKDWVKDSESQICTENEVSYNFTTYIRK